MTPPLQQSLFRRRSDPLGRCIRYFGDFERSSAISEVTAEELDLLLAPIRRTLAGPDDNLSSARAGSLANAMDEIVVTEIERWQAVFATKNIAVPA